MSALLPLSAALLSFNLDYSTGKIRPAKILYMENWGNQFWLVFNVQCGHADKRNDMSCHVISSMWKSATFPRGICRHILHEVQKTGAYFFRVTSLSLIKASFRTWRGCSWDSAASETKSAVLAHLEILFRQYSTPLGASLQSTACLRSNYSKITVKYIPARPQLTLKPHRGRKADNSDPSSFANWIKQDSICEQNCYEL